MHCSNSSTADHALQVQRLHTSTGVSGTSEPVNQFRMDHATGGLRRAQPQEWPGDSGLRTAGARGQQRVRQAICGACGRRFPGFPGQAHCGRRSAASAVYVTPLSTDPAVYTPVAGARCLRRVQPAVCNATWRKVCSARGRRSAAQRGRRSVARAVCGTAHSSGPSV